MVGVLNEIELIHFGVVCFHQGDVFGKGYVEVMVNDFEFEFDFECFTDFVVANRKYVVGVDRITVHTNCF